MDFPGKSSLQGMTPLHVWLAAQLLLVGTALLGHVAQRTSVQLKTDPPEPGEGEKQPRFYQFRKRVHSYYLLGLLWTAWLAWNLFRCYCLDKPANTRLAVILDFLMTPKHQTADSTCVFMALFMYILHLGRRLQESLCISIFSRRQLLSPLDLFWSFAFYLTSGLSIIADGPDLQFQNPCYSTFSFSWYHGIGIGLFFWASIHHNSCHIILSKLRRNRAGHIVTTGYKVPKGDWFEYVSCPHYFAEILIYISIGFLLGMRSVTWWWTVAYVITNQIFLAYNTHVWYRKKFPDYPQERKMLVPFIL